MSQQPSQYISIKYLCNEWLHPNLKKMIMGYGIYLDTRNSSTLSITKG